MTGKFNMKTYLMTNNCRNLVQNFAQQYMAQQVQADHERRWSRRNRVSKEETDLDNPPPPPTPFNFAAKFKLAHKIFSPHQRGNTSSRSSQSSRSTKSSKSNRSLARCTKMYLKAYHAHQNEILRDVHETRKQPSYREETINNIIKRELMAIDGKTRSLISVKQLMKMRSGDRLRGWHHPPSIKQFSLQDEVITADSSRETVREEKGLRVKEDQRLQQQIAKQGADKRTAQCAYMKTKLANVFSQARQDFPVVPVSPPEPEDNAAKSGKAKHKEAWRSATSILVRASRVNRKAFSAKRNRHREEIRNFL